MFKSDAGPNFQDGCADGLDDFVASEGVPALCVGVGSERSLSGGSVASKVCHSV